MFSTGRINLIKEKMVIEHHVKGGEGVFGEFTKLVENLESSGTVHVLFSGGKEENGDSWCPYCVKGNFFFFLVFSGIFY